jgi:uncharacterized protein (TIGR00369 family)
MDHEEIIKAIARIPYAQMLGVKPLFTEEKFTLIMPYSGDNIGNPTLPALHGGSVSGLMEIAAIAQLAIQQAKPRLPKPIGINVDYLRRGRPQDTYARAVVFKAGNRVANVHVRAWQDDYDKPIATMHGHYMIAKAETA